MFSAVSDELCCLIGPIRLILSLLTVPPPISSHIGLELGNAILMGCADG